MKLMSSYLAGGHVSALACCMQAQTCLCQQGTRQSLFQCMESKRFIIPHCMRAKEAGFSDGHVIACKVAMEAMAAKVLALAKLVL